MKTNDIIILAVAGLAAFYILKKGGIAMPAILQTKQQKDVALTGGAAWYDYSYDDDESGAMFSATGDDVRARR